MQQNEFTLSRFLQKKQIAQQNQQGKFQESPAPAVCSKPRLTPNLSQGHLRSEWQESEVMRPEEKAEEPVQQSLFNLQEPGNQPKGKAKMVAKNVNLAFGGLKNKLIEGGTQQMNSNQVVTEQFAADSYMAPIDLDTMEVALEKDLQTVLREEGVFLMQLPPDLPIQQIDSELLSEAKDDAAITNPENMDELLNFLVKNRFDSCGHKVNKDYSASFKNSKTIIEDKKNSPTAYHLGTMEVQGDQGVLCMGEDIKMELSLGLCSRFKQELTVLEKGQLTALSDIKYKVVANPSLDMML